MNLLAWETIFKDHVCSMEIKDPAHDLLHFQRVVKLAKELCHTEQARLDVVVPAAWLHDFIIVPKDSPDRKFASRLAAEAAFNFLSERGYPDSLIPDIAHAIEAHSFSANIPPRTIEAKIVQDADRLDALGAIGVARCFALSGMIGRPFYGNEDPFCNDRMPDDSDNALDHFHVKLLRLVDSFQTESGRHEAVRRTKFMELFMTQLSTELVAA